MIEDSGKAPKSKGFFEDPLDYVAKNHLWVLAMIVVPVSLAYDVFDWFR